MYDIAPMILGIVLVLGFVWSLKNVVTGRRLDRLARMHHELQQKVLDTLGSAEELAGYLETGAGRQLLEAPAADRSGPFGRILGSVQAGIVLLAAGAGFLVARRMVEIPNEAGVVFFGVLCVALGVGFLVSAYAAHALSKSYGLLDGGRSEAGS